MSVTIGLGLLAVFTAIVVIFTARYILSITKNAEDLSLISLYEDALEKEKQGDNK